MSGEIKHKDMRPIYIHLGESADETVIGESRWFGYPNLPDDVEIPFIEEEGERYALTFICQINLADCQCDLLPRKGLLLFFADIAYYRGDWDTPSIFMHPSDNRVCRVIYIPEEKFDTLENTRYRFYEQDEAGGIKISSDYIKPDLSEPELQLLGTTDRLEWESWPEPCEGWQLLLMMDSMEGNDYNYNFADCGALCFIISAEALQRLDFSDVRTIILST